MPYIHQRPDWPKLSWNSDKVLSLLADVRHLQGRLFGSMQSLGFDLRNEANLAARTADVLKSSAIEGEKLDQIEVRSSIARRLGLKFGGSTTASRDVEGVVEMMLDATQNYSSPLTKERLCAWHACLFPTGQSGLRKITVGTWRPAEVEPMQVVSGPMGRELVHFEAPSADRLEREMITFLQWFESERQTDPVLKAAVAHFWFVTIHPFEDGNGRIARAVADMALSRAEGTKDRFYSMSTQIETERKAYYFSLEHNQRGNTDITHWIEWFLECLRRALKGADSTIGQVLLKARAWKIINESPVNDRQRSVINRLLNGFEGKLSSSKYAKLTKCSSDTALRDIKELLKRRIIVRESAGGRSTSYRLASSLQ
ncbi:MAG: Fic family protein [Akkermansiaceae bacterium]|nr:Fic family protein [Akkermansiaceae bacterium]